MIDIVLSAWAIVVLLVALLAHRMGRLHTPDPPKPQYDAPMIPAQVSVNAVIEQYEKMLS